MAFKNIIFDIDGTMVDSYKASYISLKKALEETTHHTFPDEILSKHFGITETKFFEMIGVPYDKNMNNLINVYFNRYLKESPLFDGIIDVLDLLSKKKLTLGVVTSRNKDDYRQFLQYKITHYFRKIIIAEDTANHKPHPEPLLKIINDLGLKKEETIYIGDTIYDSECAISANVKFGLALWGALDKTVKADYYFNSPVEIVSKLEL